MNLVEILNARVESLVTRGHTAGLRSVVQHIRAAVAHLERGQQSGDDTAFTDVVYRTNQAFEGSLKEAFVVLTGTDASKSRPAEIEQFLLQKQILRKRIVDQVKQYRTDWRNPSTHDHRLDFDEDEAFLAIVSICALAIVLVDQILEKISFDEAHAAAESTPSPSSSDSPLIDRLVQSLEQFQFAGSESESLSREAELVGALRGHLTASLPGISLETDVVLTKTRSERADLLASADGARVLLEVKRVSRDGPAEKVRKSGVSQVSRYIELSGIKDAILFMHSDGIKSTRQEDIHVQPGDGTIRVVAPSEATRGVPMAKYYVLNAEEEACLLKEQIGKGGFQDFMRKRQKSYRRGSQELPVLTDEEIEQAQKYAFDYGHGTWEEDLKTIFGRHLGPTLGRD